ncbi:hypothetical protein B0H17DRAFT_1261748 [Mycena rosella]|uniref:Uncharacterized protein n=1 Tax=Mycena rosella TaxID=1033263 RepID=A0AAD7G5W1_MYCRO|nr:hypothetical protein B0H17DRAFT_1261748 [Mycena rosella]
MSANDQRAQGAKNSVSETDDRARLLTFMRKPQDAVQLRNGVISYQREIGLGFAISKQRNETEHAPGRLNIATGNDIRRLQHKLDRRVAHDKSVAAIGSVKEKRTCVRRGEEGGRALENNQHRKKDGWNTGGDLRVGFNANSISGEGSVPGGEWGEECENTKIEGHSSGPGQKEKDAARGGRGRGASGRGNDGGKKRSTIRQVDLLNGT